MKRQQVLHDSLVKNIWNILCALNCDVGFHKFEDLCHNAHLENFSLKFSRSSFVIRVNLLHP